MNTRFLFVFFCLFPFIKAISQPFSPPDIAGLRLWLEGNNGVTLDGNNNVLQWDDQSGNNNHFVQSTPANRPPFVTNNLLKSDALQFNGSPHELINSTFLNGTNFPSSEVSVFVVWALSGTINQYGVFSTRASGNGYWRFSGDGNGYMQNFRTNRLNGYPAAMPNSGKFYSSLIISPTEYNFYMNGISKGVESPDWGYGADFILGKDEQGNYLNGEIAEVIIYNFALNSAQRNQVETYLHDKYAPPLSFGPDTTSICPVVLDAGSKYTSYLWSTGATTQSITATASGTYSATVVDIFGATLRDTIVVTFPGNFSPFPGSSKTICSGSSITWDTQLDPSGYTFAWSSGATTSAINITQAGTYSVSVTDAYNCTRISDTFTVSVDDFADVGSLGPDTSVCDGSSLGLVTGYNQAISYQWSTGASSAFISISSPGTYSLIAYSANGCVLKDTIDVTIKGVAPSVDFSVSSVCFGSVTTFTDGTIVPFPDSIASWSWNFGDASGSILKNPLHTYSAAATYTATLTVISDSGCVSSVQKSVNVYAKPSTSFTHSPSFVGDTTLFSDGSSVAGGIIVFWNWNFGDPLSGANNTSNLQNPIHIYSSIGNYNVHLISTSSFGCADTFLMPVTVAEFSPVDVAGLRLWLAGDTGVTVDGNNFVSYWKDLSGNNNDFKQDSSANMPAFVSANLLRADALSFFGSGREIMSSTFLNGVNFPFSEASVFIVWGLYGPLNQYGVMSTRNAGNGYWRFGGDGNGYFQNFRNIRSNGYPVNMPDNGNYFSCLVSSASDYEFYLNGVSKGVEASDWGYGSDCILGRDENGNYINGEIAEVLIYNVALNDSLRMLVEEYLHDKYAPPLNLGPDKISICPVLLDPGPRYASYLWNSGSIMQAVSIDSSGVYYVSVVDIFGDTLYDTIVISMVGNFSPYSDTILCYGDSLVWNTQLDNAGYDFLWSNGSTDSVLVITQAGTYSVLVTDTLGCSRMSNTFSVTIDNFTQPGVVSLGPDLAMCAGAYLGLQSGAGQVSQYLWSTGATTASIQVNSTGMNTYTLTVNNANGCTVKDTINVNVKGIAPAIGFVAPSVCFGEATVYTDTSKIYAQDSIALWTWVFGDGASTSAVAPTHTYTAAGTYTTSLTLVTDSGCVVTLQKADTVHAVPAAAITVLTPLLCSKTNIQFQDASLISSGSLAAWNWDFGDASTSFVKNPVHSYSAAGTYSVQLIATSVFGCSDTAVSVITVLQSPVAQFSADTVCEGVPTTFTDNTAGTVTNWLWDFGDGMNSSLPAPTHTYSLAGSYNVLFTATATNGCSNIAVGTAVVHHLPLPGFTGDSTCAKAAISFTDTSTVTGSTLNGWQWQFGTSTGSVPNPPTGSGLNPAVTYTAAGTYSITLTATSAQGCSASVTQSLVVMPLPVPNFSFSPGYSYPQDPVSFSDLTTGAAGLQWYFGDGSTSSVPDPVHTYTSTGTYAITLVAQSAYGCVDSMVQQINIDIPKLDMSVKDVLAVNVAGTIQVSTLLENTGTKDVSLIELSTYMDDGTPVHELWSGLARPDSFAAYTFTSSFELISNKHSIVCIEIKKVNGKQDDVSANNRKCTAITDEFTLLNPFPNPTAGEIYFLFVSPDASAVKAEVIDARGRVVATPFDSNAFKGLNQISFNTSKLLKGMYWVKLSNGEKVLTKKFVKE